MFGYLVFELLKFMSRRFPFSVMLLLVRGISFFYYHADNYGRNSVISNIKLISGNNRSPRELRKAAREVFYQFGVYLIEFFRYTFDKIKANPAMFVLENQHYLDEALSRGRGVMLVSAHYGNWEIGAGMVAARGYDATVIALRHRNELIDGIFRKQRERLHVKQIYTDAGARGAIEILRNNGVLCILGDRMVGGIGAIRAEFFGKEIDVPQGPPRLACISGAAIIPLLVFREDGKRLIMRLYEPIYVQPQRWQECDMRSIAQHYLEIFESEIRKRPYLHTQFTPIACAQSLPAQSAVTITTD